MTQLQPFSRNLLPTVTRLHVRSFGGLSSSADRLFDCLIDCYRGMVNFVEVEYFVLLTWLFMWLFDCFIDWSHSICDTAWNLGIHGCTNLLLSQMITVSADIIAKPSLMNPDNVGDLRRVEFVITWLIIVDIWQLPTAVQSLFSTNQIICWEFCISGLFTVCC